MSDPKAFKIQGADGPIEIAAGDYYFNTKARAKRLMLNSLSSDARRVYQCLELATMGFQQELAVIQEAGGRRRPLSRADIALQTTLTQQNVRRGLVELEEQGLAERRGSEEGPLRKGKVEIYSWAEPRPAQKRKLESRATPLSETFPDSWESLKTLANRLKIQLVGVMSDEQVGVALAPLEEEGEEEARALQAAEMRAARFLKRVSAQLCPNNVERTKELERTITSAAAVSDDSDTVVPSPPKAAAAAAPTSSVEVSRYAEFKNTYPRVQFDEAKAKPLFESLQPDEQTLVLARLPAFVDSELWQQKPHYIPFASNFLKVRSYAFDPPELRPAADQQLHPKDQQRLNALRQANDILKGKQARGEL